MQKREELWREYCHWLEEHLKAKRDYESLEPAFETQLTGIQMATFSYTEKSLAKVKEAQERLDYAFRKMQQAYESWSTWKPVD
jgi:hypothetical protein